MQYKKFRFSGNDKNILALGAELKSTFCAVTGEDAYLSETFNDLKQYDNYGAYRDSIAAFMRERDFKPDVIVADLHPNYLSTQYGRELAGGSLVQVGHHFAHAAACMADNALDEPVLGVAFDGSGYGTDGRFWGGEFVVGGPAEFRRAAHPRYIPLPGADKAAIEPYRMAVSYLYQTYGGKIYDLDIPVVSELGRGKIQPLIAMVEKKINCPLSSSVGRLFDGVSSILRLCDVNETEAQAAIALQNAADESVDEPYAFEINHGGGCHIIDPRPMIDGIVADMREGVPNEIISGKFHTTVAEMIALTLSILREESGLGRVVLAGGVFLNSLLKSKVDALLRAEGFDVHFHKNAPTGDASISLGQAYMTAAGFKA
ncbi:MAG: hypothetical protein DRP79_00945 [Planctomycetota bacterium]|nr:MAG: hypothetical protein DRP79_00945 [Planctomycetota bacterium]